VATLPVGVPLFDRLADVYTQNPTTGLDDVVAVTGLACRLAHNRVGAGIPLSDRAELASSRRLIWDPAVFLPEHCSVVVDGVTWRPAAGTFQELRDWTGRGVYREAMVTRQETV
jgi:hypothetical protein